MVDSPEYPCQLVLGNVNWIAVLNDESGLTDRELLRVERKEDLQALQPIDDDPRPAH